MPPRLASVVICCFFASAEAREWRSVDGKNTVVGDFIKLVGDQLFLKTAPGQTRTVKLSLLAPDDQRHAQTSQSALAEGLKQGPRDFEIVQPINHGTLCRFGLKMSTGTLLFTGQQFILIDAANSYSPGNRLSSQTLYPAGQRTFHPTQGPPHPVPVFALSVDEAATYANNPGGDFYEPLLEITEAQGLGFAIDESGLVLVDSVLVEGATSIDLDIGSNHAPGRVVVADPKLGLTVLACKAELVPARLAPRKPLELGQTVFAMSFGLSSTKRSISQPAITKGIISKLTGTGIPLAFFQHDATVDAEALGGVVLSEKGDVIGLMQSRPRIKKAGSRTSSSADPVIASLGLCLRTEALVEFLKTVPKAGSIKAASPATLAESAETFRKSVVIVKALRHQWVPVTAPANATPGPTGGAITGWSLSKSGVRHSSKCRYYDAAKACQAGEGTACKVCGG